MLPVFENGLRFPVLGMKILPLLNEQLSTLNEIKERFRIEDLADQERNKGRARYCARGLPSSTLDTINRLIFLCSYIQQMHTYYLTYEEMLVLDHRLPQLLLDEKSPDHPPTQDISAPMLTDDDE